MTVKIINRIAGEVWGVDIVILKKKEILDAWTFNDKVSERTPVIQVFQKRFTEDDDECCAFCETLAFMRRFSLCRCNNASFRAFFPLTLDPPRTTMEIEIWSANLKNFLIGTDIIVAHKLSVRTRRTKSKKHVDARDHRCKSSFTRLPLSWWWYFLLFLSRSISYAVNMPASIASAHGTIAPETV